jgi:hypothetical protein
VHSLQSEKTDLLTHVEGLASELEQAQQALALSLQQAASSIKSQPKSPSLQQAQSSIKSQPTCQAQTAPEISNVEASV